jgi:hypothetical protein
MKNTVDQLLEEAALNADREKARKQIVRDLDEFIEHYYPPFKEKGLTLAEALQVFKLHEIEQTLCEAFPLEVEEDE